MNTTNLPLAFAIVGCIFLFLFAMIAYTEKYTHLNLRNYAMFTGICIAFNVSLFLEQRFPDAWHVYHMIALILGSILLIHFILFSSALLGIRIVEKKISLILFVMCTAPLMIVLFHFICEEQVGFHHSEIGIIGLSGTVLFGCILVLCFLCGDRKKLNFKWLKRISFVYLALTALLIILFQMKFTAGILVHLNVLFLMMVFTNILVLRRKPSHGSCHKLCDYKLTRRQTEVAHLIMNGLTYCEIADKLSIAENTASKHGSDIFTKTNCQDRNAFFAKFFEEHQSKVESKAVYSPFLQQAHN